MILSDDPTDKQDEQENEENSSNTEESNDAPEGKTEETSNEEGPEEEVKAEATPQEEAKEKEAAPAEESSEEEKKEEPVAEEEVKEEAPAEEPVAELKEKEKAPKEEPKGEAAAKKADKSPEKDTSAGSGKEKEKEKEEPAPVVDEEMSEPQEKFDVSIKDGKVEISTKEVSLPDFGAGDTVSVHYKIKEGSKERIQQFKGVVLQRRGSGTTETITVRKVTGGIGVERIFPLHSPFIDQIEVNKRGKVRRARIFYLRKLKGKGARLKEKRT